MANYYMNFIPNDKGDNGAYNGMKDNGYSNALLTKLDSEIKPKKIEKELKAGASNKKASEQNLFASLYHKNNIRRTRGEIYSTSDNGGPLFTQTYRFGLSNPYGAITSAREYLFFTKPDLHLYTADYKLNKETGNYTLDMKSKKNLERNPGLSSYFWQDLFDHKDRIIRCLQSSYGGDDQFNHLLQNTVNSNLELPSLNAPSIETSTNT